jgi:hypothetical protein
VDTVAEIWIIRNQKGRRNASTYVMVGLGEKLKELLTQKGLENIKDVHSFDKLVKKGKHLVRFLTSYFI